MTNIIETTISNNKTLICLPENYDSEKNGFPVAYVLGINSEDQIKKIQSEIDFRNLITVAISCEQWEKYFTPWIAPSLKNRNPFEGCASDFLETVERIIKPEVDKKFCVYKNPEKTILAGYSLAGLTAIYSAYVVDFSSNFAGVSASLWYPQWCEFCKKNELKNPQNKNRFYLSVGDKEHVTKNKLMASVDDCFRETEKILQAKSNTEVFFEFNSGGHFNECEKRLAQGINYLCNKMI